MQPCENHSNFLPFGQGFRSKVFPDPGYLLLDLLIMDNVLCTFDLRPISGGGVGVEVKILTKIRNYGIPGV